VLYIENYAQLTDNALENFKMINATEMKKRSEVILKLDFLLY
jgi:hypothetical protein